MNLQFYFRFLMWGVKNCHGIDVFESTASAPDRNVYPSNFQIPWTIDSFYYHQPFFFFTRFGVVSFLTDYIEHSFEVLKEIFSPLGNQFLRFTSKPQNMYLCQILPCYEKLLKNLLEMQLARFAAKLHTLNLIFS